MGLFFGFGGLFTWPSMKRLRFFEKKVHCLRSILRFAPSRGFAASLLVAAAQRRRGRDAKNAAPIPAVGRSFEWSNLHFLDSLDTLDNHRHTSSETPPHKKETVLFFCVSLFP